MPKVFCCQPVVSLYSKYSKYNPNQCNSKKIYETKVSEVWEEELYPGYLHCSLKTEANTFVVYHCGSYQFKIGDYLKLGETKNMTGCVTCAIWECQTAVVIIEPKPLPILTELN